MGRGRPRKPVDLHVAQGTYRPDRHCARGVSGAAGEPREPPGLDRYGKELWHGTILELISAGVLKELDSLMVAEMCRWYSIYRRSLTTRREKMYRRVVMAKMAWNEVNSIASRMGLTPVDREKIRAKPDELADPLGDFA